MLSVNQFSTIDDLRSQINKTYKITDSVYWLSCCGKPLHNLLPVDAISGHIFMNGRLLGGAQCCIRGCSNEAGPRKFDSMIGRYELTCATSLVTTGDEQAFKDLRVCDKHYSSLSGRGHKPAKGKKAAIRNLEF